MKNIRTLSGPVSAYFYALVAITLTVSMVLFPEEAFSAAVKGLDVWWNIVFPALLPFFVGSEILMGLGVVHMMGVLLEPLMRPVFNVPGEGSFVMAMGLASGFPIGAILTTRLRRENLCSKVEGERLMSFTNTADPLFMFGAVAVGMFGAPHVGYTIAAAHYLSSISTGLLLRFYGRGQANTPEARSRGNILLRSLRALVEARKKDGRPLGQLLGDAVRNSANTLMLIGGFIILFSVIIRILTVVGVVGMLSKAFAVVLVPLGLDPELIPALFSGLFEVTLGCQLAGEALQSVALLQKVMVAGAIIAWSGLSVHAQVASIISDTDMSIVPFICARFIHAVLAALFTFVLWERPVMAPGQSIPVFLGRVPGSQWFFWQRSLAMGWRFLLLCIVMMAAGLVTGTVKNIKTAWFRS